MAKKAAEVFRTNLRVLCEGRQRTVADEAGISLVHLNRIINNHTDPSLDVAFAIAKALGKPLGELLQPISQRASVA